MFKFTNPSLVTRVAIGKITGFFIGLIGFICLPYFMPEVSLLFRWGILLWYLTLGAIIGAFGVFTYHPILKISLPWFFRAPVLGAWMNFVLVLLSYQAMQDLMLGVFGESGMFASPFWLVLEGAIVGLIIGYLATRFAGEGEETAGK